MKIATRQIKNKTTKNLRNAKVITTVITHPKIQPEFSFGNDFEFFLFSKERNKIVSAIDVVKHGKDDPINLDNGVNCYYDNCLIEFSLNPYHDKPEMVNTFRDAFTRVQNHLGENYALIPQSAHVFDAEEVASEEAQRIGCSPSFDAYTLATVMNQPFQDGLRTSGGHFHIGSKMLQEDFDARIDTIKLCDIFLGCANVVYDQDITSKQRRVYYGQPGNHRNPPHGTEYRTLSSSFLMSKETTELTFDLLRHALSHFKTKTVENVIKSVDSNMVIEAINNCDKKLANEVLVRANTPKDLMKRIHAEYTFDFYKSWGLSK